MQAPEVATGRFGFCTIFTGSVGEELECFVASQDEEWSIILVPQAPSAASPSSGAGSFDIAGSGSDVDLTLLVPGTGGSIRVEVKRVDAGSVRAVPQTRNVSSRFETRPKPGELLAAFYQSELASGEGQAKVNASATEDNGRTRRALQHENQKLKKEMEDMRRALMERGGKLREAADHRAATPSRAERHNLAAHDGSSDGADSGDTGEDATQDGLVRQMKELEVEATLRQRCRNGSAPMPPFALRRQDQGGDAGPGAESNRRVRAPRGQGNAASSSGAIPLEAAVDPNLQVQLEILKLLQKMQQGDGRGDAEAPAGGELDGVRVYRTLSRMRALKEELEAYPERIGRPVWAHAEPGGAGPCS